MYWAARLGFHLWHILVCLWEPPTSRPLYGIQFWRSWKNTW